MQRTFDRWTALGWLLCGGLATWAQPVLTTVPQISGEVELRWPASEVDYVLETAGTVGAGELWTPVGRVAEHLGEEFVLRLPAGGNAAFFRLRQGAPQPAPPCIHLASEALGLGKVGPLVARPDGTRAYAGRVYSAERSRRNLACLTLDPQAGRVLGVTFSEDSSNQLPLEGRSSVGRMTLHPGGRKLYWLIHQDFPYDGAREPVAELVVADLDEAGDLVGPPRAFPCPSPVPYLDALELHAGRGRLYVGGYASSALFHYALDATGEPQGPAETTELGTMDIYEIRISGDRGRLLVGYGESQVAAVDLDPGGSPRADTLQSFTFGENTAAPIMRFIVAGRGLFRSGVDYRLLSSPIALQGWSLGTDGLPPGTPAMVHGPWMTLAGPVAVGDRELIVAQADTMTDAFTGEVFDRGFSVRRVPLGADGWPAGSVSTVAQIFRRRLLAMTVTERGLPVLATEPPTPGPRGYFPGNEVRGFFLRVTPTEVVPSAPELVDGYDCFVTSPAGDFLLPEVREAGQSGVVDIDQVHQVGVVPISVLAGSAGPVLFSVRAMPRALAPEPIVTISRSRWRVEVFDGPVAGRTPLKVLEEEVEGDQLAFLIPGYGLLEDGQRVAGMQTLNDHVAGRAALAQRVAVPNEDRPRLFMASAFHNLGTQPSLVQLTNSTTVLASLGFNTLLPDAWSGLDSNTVNQVFDSNGLTGRSLAFFAPLLGHPVMPESSDLTYFDFFLRDHDEALTNWLDLSIRDYERGGASSRAKVVDLKIADEPGWYYPWKLDDVRTNALFQSRFTDYLASKGLTPADVGASTWAEVAPQGGGFLLNPDPPLTRRRLFYWTARFYAESAVEGMARTRRAAEQVIGHDLDVDVNWNNFYNEWYTPSPNAPLYHNPSEGPDAAVGSMDWFYAGRLSAHTLWSEDWFTDQDAQEWSFRGDLLRSASMEGESGFGAYVIGVMTGTRPWGTAQKVLALVGHGGKGIEMYTWGPSVFTIDGWSGLDSVYPSTARALQLLGRSERVLFPGVASRGSVAVLLPSASRLWDAGAEWPLYLEEARFQHYALVHAGYAVDLLDEEALASNAFAARGYQVLYLNGPNLPAEAVAHLETWVQAGGVLVATPGSAVADLYNEPHTLMQDLTGVGAREAVRLISPQPLLRVGECVLADPAWGTNSIPVMTPGIHLSLVAASPLATWADGGTAIAQRTLGAGRVLTYGFFPGQQYWITADRDGALGSPFYFTRLPSGWGKAQRDMAVLPARMAQARRPAITSHELVEACVLRSTAGIGVVLLNWTDATIPDFSVTLPDVGAFTRASTATGEQVTVSEDGGLTTFRCDLGPAEVLLLERP